MGSLLGRSIRPAWLCLGLLAACGASPGSGGQQAANDDPLRYLDDSGFRRAALEASIVNPSNEYSAQRLAHYESGDGSDWALLPEWNPLVEPIAARELDGPGGASATGMTGRGQALDLPASVASVDDPALLALGKAAFERYPTQLAPYLGVAIGSRQDAQHYGLWVDARHGVGGVVRARMGDGSVQLAVTCSSCHARPDANGTWTAGLPGASLDLGAAMVAAQGPLLDPAVASAIAAWGPGRLDVTTERGTEPVRIPDLRPLRWLTYLHQDATLRARDIVAVAIRIETLVITSSDQVIRPPRIVALALAAYLMSLGGSLPAESDAAAGSPRGAELFGTQCTMCHERPGLTGDPVPLGVVGTDPHLGESAVRGTGTYRVQSLHGVGTRGPLLHDGTVPSLTAMFDPARVTPAFQGKLHGEGAVAGHTYGLDLPDADRAALVAYLQGL